MHHLSRPLFVFAFFFVLYLPPVPTSPPSAGGGGMGGAQDILPKCACLCVRSDAPRCLKHQTDLSIWSPPSAIKTGIVYTGGREVSSSLCLSVTLSLSLPRLFYTQTVCTDVPLTRDPECPLQRHLSERGVSGIIRSAVTDDAEEQGQRWLRCHVKSSTAFGVTLILISHSAPLNLAFTI